MARKVRKEKEQAENSGANLGFEAQLWAAANALRLPVRRTQTGGSMDAAEYKHVVLGLIFLKYISDAFEEQCTWRPEIGQTPQVMEE